MPTQIEILLEGERRGLLPPDKTAILAEARRRGMVKTASNEQPANEPAVSKQPVSEDWQRKTAISATRAEHPVLAGSIDFLAGMSELGRSALNKLPGDLGDIVFSGDDLDEVASKNSAARIAGSFADPVAWGVGLEAAKILPYTKVLGGGIINAVKAFGMNVIGGAAPGAIVGGLSEDGDAKSGAGIGAAANVILPPTAGAAAKGIRKVWTTLHVAERAAVLLRKIAGVDLPAIRAATAAAPKGYTAAQSAAKVNNDTFNALDALARRHDIDSFYSRLDVTQKQDLLDDLYRLSRGSNQTEAKQAAEAAKKALNRITDPMRKTALESANGARKALAANGVQPLDMVSLTSKLQGMIDDPKIGASKVNKRILTSVLDQITDWTQKNGGVIDAEALYTIRKGAIGDEVERLIGGLAPKAKAARAADLLTRVKPLVDDAIVSSGGSGWRHYLLTYEWGARQIERQRMGAKALDLLQKNPRKLESLAAGNEPKMVKDIFKTEYDLGLAMGTKMNQPIKKAAAALERDRLIKEGGKRGKQALGNVLREESYSFRLPNLLNRDIAITNRGLDEIEARVNKKTMEAIYKAMRSGKDANTLLNVVPIEERSKVIKVLAKTQYSPKTRAFLMGMLEGEQEAKANE